MRSDTGLDRAARVIVTLVLVGVAGGPKAVVAAGPLQFYAIPPCRVVDTRSGLGGFTGLLPNGVIRTFTIKGAAPCYVPTDAVAVSFNITVADPANSGWVALWPFGVAYPNVSTINFSTGENVANGAIVPVTAGAPDLYVLAAFAPGPSGVNLILDVNGYFK